MVFGIGEGGIEIKLGKSSFTPGETVSGEVALNLSAPKKARQLRVAFFGEVKEQRSHGSGSRRRTSTQTRRIYETVMVLGGEQEYAAGTHSYPFQLKIPSIPAGSKSGEGTIGAVIGFVSAVLDPLSGARWYIESSLDIAMAFDITKKVQVNIIR